MLKHSLSFLIIAIMQSDPKIQSSTITSRKHLWTD